VWCQRLRMEAKSCPGSTFITSLSKVFPKERVRIELVGRFAVIGRSSYISMAVFMCEQWGLQSTLI